MFNELPFRMACENGHLDVAQWLLFVKPTIDISIEDEKSLRLACKYGHLHVAQWLLTINTNIDICKWADLNFINMCSYGHANVAQWLHSFISDNYVLIVENNEIMNYYKKRVIPSTNNIIELCVENTEDLDCPICYDKVEVQTNCGHNFCASCITEYYNKCKSNCACPCCRQLLTHISQINVSNQ